MRTVALTHLPVVSLEDPFNVAPCYESVYRIEKKWLPDFYDTYYTLDQFDINFTYSHRI